MAGRRRRADARENRSAILAAAAQALHEGDGAPLQELAQRAGVSRSTLHRHFPSRAAIDEALVDQALVDAQELAESLAEGGRPPLAALRDLVTGLADIGGRRHLDALEALPLGARAAVLRAPLRTLLERLAAAIGLEPSPPAAVVDRAADQLTEACLLAGARPADDGGPTPDELFNSLTEPLDRGLALLDPKGVLLSQNATAAEALGAGRSRVGREALHPDAEVVYEDGSPCPPSQYPLAVALRAGGTQRAVIGHPLAEGQLRWLDVHATPLLTEDNGTPYAYVGVFSDITAETGWELERMRPAGELRPSRPVPLDIARVLDEIPPHLFPEQFASEARRVAGGPVALYVLDIDGTHLLRLAGPEEFPARLEAPLALGPELAVDGLPALRAKLEVDMPGVVMAPMWLRRRAVGILLGTEAPEEALTELGRHGAAAMELAGGYTDIFDAARRRKETEPAAELQQSLLPPRIAKLGAGELAGSVLPSYEVGGDWFDYVENRDGAWIAIADAVGKGATAGALGAIALAALRAARRGERGLEEAVQLMDDSVRKVGRPEFFVTCIVARWNAVYESFSWVNCGHPPPLVVSAQGNVEQLMTTPALPLGLGEEGRRFVRSQRRIAPDERLILHSDGITARRTATGLFGLDGVERAVARASSRSATAIARQIQEDVMAASEDPLQDDAVAVVLAPQAD